MFERDDVETPEQIAAREEADKAAHRFVCRTKGIKMRDDIEVDDEGFHFFYRDSRIVCPFETLDRLMAAAGAKPDPVADARFAMVRSRLLREARERAAQR